MTEADLPGRTFGCEQVEDGAAALITEQLAEMFLVKADPMGAQQVDEVTRSIGPQDVAGKARLAGQEASLVVAVQIREIAAATARDPDLLAESGRMVEDDDTQAALAGLGRTELAGSAGADHGNIESFHRPWDASGGGAGADDRLG